MSVGKEERHSHCVVQKKNSTQNVCTAMSDRHSTAWSTTDELVDAEHSCMHDSTMSARTEICGAQHEHACGPVIQQDIHPLNPGDPCLGVQGRGVHTQQQMQKQRSPASF
jgi:hypothetical protein